MRVMLQIRRRQQAISMRMTQMASVQETGTMSPNPIVVIIATLQQKPQMYLQNHQASAIPLAICQFSLASLPMAIQLSRMAIAWAIRILIITSWIQGQYVPSLEWWMMYLLKERILAGRSVSLRIISARHILFSTELKDISIIIRITTRAPSTGKYPYRQALDISFKYVLSFPFYRLLMSKPKHNSPIMATAPNIIIGFNGNARASDQTTPNITTITLTKTPHSIFNQSDISHPFLLSQLVSLNSLSVTGGELTTFLFIFSKKLFNMLFFLCFLSVYFSLLSLHDLLRDWQLGLLRGRFNCWKLSTEELLLRLLLERRDGDC